MPDSLHDVAPAPILAPLHRRLWQYQHERFPVLVHGPVISVFTAAAFFYSRQATGQTGPVPWWILLQGIGITFGFFLLLRILDEFKDHQLDCLYRSQLPVPRGLIRLHELAIVAALTLGGQIALLLAFQPQMLSIFLLVLVVLLLMQVSFFIPRWLASRPLAHTLSHMVIIPVIDLYSSGLDWRLGGSHPPQILFLFLAFSYFNGLVIELGRKLRLPADEQPGVSTYSRHYGLRPAIGLWLLALTLAWLAAVLALRVVVVSHNQPVLLLTLWFSAAAIMGAGAAARPGRNALRGMEAASLLWTFLSCLTLCLPTFN